MIFYMIIQLMVSALLVATTLSSALLNPDYTAEAALAKVSTVYQFPDGTWMENLDQRRTGQILATEVTNPRVWQVDPTQPPTQTPVLIANIVEKNGLLGITEISTDVFAVIGGNFTSDDIVAGSFSIYTIDMSETPPVTTKLVDIHEARLLNGMDFVPAAALKPLPRSHSSHPKGFLLITDSFTGSIWSVDIATGAAKIWLQDPNSNVSCAPASTSSNGIKYNHHDKKVYFANTSCQGGYIASIPLDTATGLPAGGDSAMVTLVGGKSQSIRPDDFDIDPRANRAYVAANTYDQIRRLDLVSGHASVVAGVVNSSLIAQPTSVRIGKTAIDSKLGLFYVSTAGIYGDNRTGGQILAIRN